MPKKKSSLFLIGAQAFVAVIVSMLFCACATTRLNQFKGFAEVSDAYVQAVSTLLNEAGSAAIDTDSMTLVKTRPALRPEERQERILEHNQLMRERLDLLSDLQRHARLLQNYFQALGLLAASDTSSAILTALDSTFASLGKVSPRIADAKIGGTPVSTLLGEAARITVAKLQVKALEDELKRRGQTIERELALQEAALTAISETMRTDLQAQMNQTESQAVVLPYVTASSLPANWAYKRRQVLTASIAVDSATAAVDAAAGMKTSFLALVEGRLQISDLSGLNNDINEILTLMERVGGKTE